ncbi:hypothetical protein QOZ98_000510 [Planomicrobium stackebrandtii]|uniref:Minor capsid protein n=1 Tax=Planomicrobium stackebrandtii TaxID=253160 RepID=A0ABU0GQQ3_9BACL|nr:phage minor capsid protein [Planomicrobium stackebrandtii]MDQ0427685.1 hypothetical protein [Planomicrobium stackebrandtii]
MNEEQLLKYFEEIILELSIAIAEKDLTEEEQQAELAEEIQLLFESYGAAILEAIPQLIIEKYFGGVDQATGLLVNAGVAVQATAALTVGGLVAKEYQKKIHLDAVAEILDDTLSDLQAAFRTAELNAISNINETVANVKGDIAKGLIIGDPRKVMQAKVAKSFSEGGLTSFVTKDNKELPLDFYAMTVTRTKMRDAAVKGSADRYTDSGQDLVKIVGNSDLCGVCAKYRNLVVSLSGNTPGYPKVGDNGIKLPPFHPNDRCGVQPFVARFKTDDEIAEAKKRNGQYDPEKDNRTAAQKRAYEKEQTARRQANAEKKQFMRWQQALGADAPKTLGAFRRMKRSNSPKFQELQSNYRSLMQTKTGE